MTSFLKTCKLQMLNHDKTMFHILNFQLVFLVPSLFLKLLAESTLSILFHFLKFSATI